MTKTPTEWQNREILKLLALKRGGVCWDMGLGKTGGASTIGGLAKCKRWLIICGDNAFTTWRDEAPLWIQGAWPECQHIKAIFMDGSPRHREILWINDVLRDSFSDTIAMFIVTPDTFIRDWSETIRVSGKRKKIVRFIPKPNYYIPNIVILDESRRYRNPDTISFQVVSKFLTYYHPTHVYPMTGTPGHEPKHFWSTLNMIAPKTFPSYWQFIYQFHQVDDGYWGKEINEPKNLDAFHQILNKYFSIVTETDPEIIQNRPPIQRQLLSIQMDPTQRRMYNELTKNMMTSLEITPNDTTFVVAQNELALMTRLRQLLICPELICVGSGIGAAIKDFIDTIEPNTHVVIFTPFTKAMPIFKGFLGTKGYEHVYTLWGGMGTNERDRQIEQYRQNNGVMLCSLLYAQSFTLEPATKSFFIGYSWDPDDNVQAEKRLQRGLQPLPISSYYYTFRSTFDERLAEIVNIKQRRMNITIPAPHNQGDPQQ